MIAHTHFVRIASVISLLWATTGLAQAAGSRSSRTNDVALPTGYVALDAIAAPQGALAAPVSVSADRQPLGEVLALVAQQARLQYLVDRGLVGLDKPVTLHARAIAANVAVLRVLADSPLRALVGPGGQLIIVPRRAVVRDSVNLPQEVRVRLSGYVRSKASREVIRHALVTADDDNARRESNEEGFYTLLLSPGSHRVRVRAIGFAPFDTTLSLTSNFALDLMLGAPSTTLNTVTVVASKTDRPDLDPRLPDMSTVRLDLTTVRRAPVVLGEPDVIRSLALLPGVSTSSDASTSFSVRGGSADQNLILLDEANIYNPSHLFGFLSVFNADAVDDITLYKGAIPARFGGRLSSVVDIRQREGNSNEFAGNASIGLLSSRATIEGPLPTHAGSFMVAGRRSYADIFLKAASDTALRDNTAYFYDFNAKTTVRLGAHGALLASGYLGRDRFKTSDAFAAQWGNKSATLRWNQDFGGRLFSKVTLANSKYDYQLDFPLDTKDSVRWTAGIRSVDLKMDQTLYLTDKNSLEFGAELTDQSFTPGTIDGRGANSTLKRRAIEQRHAREGAVYVGQEVSLGSRMALRYGLRASGFDRRGAATIYRYANGAPVVWNKNLGRYDPGRIVDSTKYASGTSVSRFGGLEPRISGRFSLTDVTSLKASFARTRQYVQLATKTNSPTPIDVWEPAGPHIKPQQSDQVAVGYSTTRGQYELSVETYLKRSSNVVDFVDGADIVLNQYLETVLVQGEGRAYGLELYARRRTGTITGWVSYTLGRAEQRFRAPVTGGTNAGSGINDGRYYPSPTDKTHNLSVVAIRNFGAKWIVGSTFTLASGLPTTFPSSRYYVDGLLIAEFGDRNSSRLPLYHRLDLSATRKFGRGELQFGILNAYNRYNAQSLRFRQSVADPQRSEAVQTSIFGVLPSVSYVFRF